MRKPGVANSVCYVQCSDGQDKASLGVPVFVMSWGSSEVFPLAFIEVIGAPGLLQFSDVLCDQPRPYPTQYLIAALVYPKLIPELRQTSRVVYAAREVQEDRHGTHHYA